MSARALMDVYPKWSVTFVKGEGAILTDDKGRDYLDFLAGIAVVSLGHCDPAVTETLCRQSAKLVHCSNLFANENAERAAQRLSSLFRADMRVFFTNSGAETVEAALKLIRRARPGRPKILSLAGAFHGRTFGALSATHQSAKQDPFAPLVPGFEVASPVDAAMVCEQLRDPAVGGIIMEVIQGEAGVRDLQEEYLTRVCATAKEAGVLVCIDEIQTGMGRTGKWMAFEHARLDPDIVTVAKALGNGVPVGALVAKEEVAARFLPGDHGTTYGGNSLVTAVVSTVIEEIDKRGLVGHAADVGEVLARELRKCPGVKEVTGRGLLRGVVLETPSAKEVAARALANGLVVNAPTEDRIRLAPPLVVTQQQCSQAVDLLGAAIAEVEMSEVSGG
jgi:acetylornithine/N-succinyldiaminopimelate aminotransferase